LTFPDLRAYLDRLRRDRDLVEVTAPVSPRLEAAEIHRRVIAAGGPALLFSNVEGSICGWRPTSSARRAGPSWRSASGRSSWCASSWRSPRSRCRRSRAGSGRSGVCSATCCGSGYAHAVRRR
jgi:hypothetical protein